MANYLKYKDYISIVEYSTTDQIFHGKIEMINDEIVILNKSIPASHAILIVLYVNEGSSSKEKIQKELSKYYSVGNISTSLGNNIKSRKIHKDENGIYHLTAFGFKCVKELLNDYN